ncbi:MAG: YihY/virulence factor BrkB family protein, partial [Planctomycetes bacterium]|nr:YihY/virulence factor BrkB family protein [Planctomycetota bacterium]
WIVSASYFFIKWGVACGFMLMAASIIYWVVPSADVPWHWFSPGSVYATAGWVIVMWGFRVFVENFARYNETYGALAGVIVLMTWLYLTGSVLLMGGQINGIIYRAEMLSRDAGNQQQDSDHGKSIPRG